MNDTVTEITQPYTNRYHWNFENSNFVSSLITELYYNFMKKFINFLLVNSANQTNWSTTEAWTDWWMRNWTFFLTRLFAIKTVSVECLISIFLMDFCPETFYFWKIEWKFYWISVVEMWQSIILFDICHKFVKPCHNLISSSPNAPYLINVSSELKGH